MIKKLGAIVSLITVATLLSACGAPGNFSASLGRLSTVGSAADVRVTSGSYDAKTQTVTLYAQSVGPMATGENVVDVRGGTGVANYVAARYPGDSVRSVALVENGRTMRLPVSQTVFAVTVSSPRALRIPPPGVTLDPAIQALAGVHASETVKFHAVLSVAMSKLGTPYIWGHNEDRGQYGFDCSNFTAYVYHHALGYRISGASQTQYRSVGLAIPGQDLRPGDLMVFEQGAHVGIYIGQGRMIEEGGGLGRVGYLPVSGGSYWGNRITVIKRMF